MQKPSFGQSTLLLLRLVKPSSFALRHLLLKPPVRAYPSGRLLAIAGKCSSPLQIVQVKQVPSERLVSSLHSSSPSTKSSRRESSNAHAGLMLSKSSSAETLMKPTRSGRLKANIPFRTRRQVSSTWQMEPTQAGIGPNDARTCLIARLGTQKIE